MILQKIRPSKKSTTNVFCPHLLHFFGDTSLYLIFVIGKVEMKVNEEV